VLVRKKDGTLRFCIDFHPLNRRTIKNAYPMPRVDETIEALVGAKWFSTLDLKSGYWQMELEESHKAYTAFTVGRLEFFECNRMPFGLTGAPASFQHLMQTVMGDLHLKKSRVYIDDVVIFSSTFEEHLSRVREVLDRLRSANLKLKAKKCYFLQTKIQYLGHVVTEAGVECDSSKTEVIQKWQPPCNIKELRRPLTKLLEGDKPKRSKKSSNPSSSASISWGSEQQESFDRLKQLMISPPILAFPDYSKPFIVPVEMVWVRFCVRIKMMVVPRM
jgi:hypothetical protein